MRVVERLACTNAWRRRHPGEKLLLGGALLVQALALPPWPGDALVFCAAVGCALLGARLPVSAYTRLLALPASFLLGGSAVVALSLRTDGAGLALHVDAVGLNTALAASARAMAATSALLLIVLTTPIAELLAMLRQARVPAPIVDLMLLIYRLAALALATAENARVAQAGRLGYAGPARAMRSAGMLAASLLPRVLDRAARMQTGLASRRYAGELRVLAPSRQLSIAFVSGALSLDAAILALSLIIVPLLPDRW